MDTSFTFVTALTPATGKIKGVPKFPKLSTEKKSKLHSEIFKSSGSVLISNRRFDFLSTSHKTDDSIPSLKSRSESIHLSSDKSDHEEKHSSTFNKFIKEVHAGFERITFRRKKIRNLKNTLSVEQLNDDDLNNIDIGGKLKASTPTNDCDISSIRLKSRSLEDICKLDSQMCNLSLEKNQSKTPRRSKNINKKLFSATHENKKKLGFDDSSGIISDDISPIPRISVAPLDNMYVESDDLRSPFGNVSKLDVYDISDIFVEKLIPKEVKSIPKTKDGDNKKKVRRILLEKNKENEMYDNEDKTQKTKNKGKVKKKPVAPKIKGKKKKDSFIVSDESLEENESITVYHKFIAENIKIDVIKTTTPRSKYKNNPEFHDDGIFTPFINKGKRSSSEDSDSEKESDEKSRIKKKRLSSSEDECGVSKPRNLLSSLTSLSSENKFNAISSSSESLPIEIERKKRTKLRTRINPKIKSKPRAKKVILSDSSSSPTNSLKNISSDASVVTPGSSKKITFKLKNLKNLTPAHTPHEKEPLSFLKSLSTLISPHSVHPEAEKYRKSFKKLKEELARKLFELFNKEVFDSRLPDDMKIEWNPRMRSSSGLCYNRRIKTIGPNNECLRVSRIALSPKIIETPERLRDTLIHEMCHAAAWIIDNKADGHGPCWKSWVIKAQRRFPELPPIKRCHDYSVNTKFKYRCVNCGYTIGRHSKSLNLERKRCGYCYGRFELLLNQQHSKSGSVNTSPRNVKVKPLSKFALFVKENYSKVKIANNGLKHGEIMKVLSKNFADTKI